MRSLESLRVICTKCPAEARVHYREVAPWADEVLAWVECHGEQRFVAIDGEAIMAGDGEVFWKRLRDVNAQEQFEAWESRLVEVEERLAVYRRVVEATKR